MAQDTETAKQITPEVAESLGLTLQHSQPYAPSGKAAERFQGQWIDPANGNVIAVPAGFVRYVSEWVPADDAEVAR